MSRYFLGVFSIALSATAVLAAQQAPPPQFVTEAAASNVAEVEMSRMAAQKSTNREVKRFAQMMIEDHTKAGKELQALAKQHHWKLPTAPTSEHKSTLTDLRKKSGADFDRAYASEMLKDHEKDVELFRQAASQEQLDPKLRQFAQKTLPTLEHHLAEARRLNSEVASAAK
ncbi:MAG: DUF4142 domain-containing protein [Candidatus Binatia bacterium]